MSAAGWFLASAAGLSLTIIVWGVVLVRSGSERRVGQLRRIRVDGAYVPTVVHVRAGEPVALVFRREETAPCSERVVFPDFGISVALPPFEDVTVQLPASEPGEHEFTCEMRMLHGRLVVDPVEERRHVERAAVAS